MEIVSGCDGELPVTAFARPLIQAPAEGGRGRGETISGHGEIIERLAPLEVLWTREIHLPSELGLRSRRGGDHE